MSSPNYKMEDFETLDDYSRRKIDEHQRIDRLVKANSKMLTYEVKTNDPQYPHPPTHYLVTYFLKSYIGIREDQTPVEGEVHELSIKLPKYFPEQTAESKMLSPTWHPNIKSSGPFAGDICTNHRDFGALYHLDELIVRIGEFLQYKRYLAEDRKPWPEDPVVARWVKNFAEPGGLVNKVQGLFVDNQAWILSFEEDVTPESDLDSIEFFEKESSEDFGQAEPDSPNKSDFEEKDPEMDQDEIIFPDL